jgi:5-methylcytosine-specific restriction endonuclease McrA
MEVKNTCAGCFESIPISSGFSYRKHFVCSKVGCRFEVDKKVKSFNRKKKDKAKRKGRYRKGVPKDLRKIVIQRDNSTCQRCYIHLSTIQIHHIVPVSDGGLDDVSNLICLCGKCHSHIHKTGWSNYVTILSSKIKTMGV